MHLTAIVIATSDSMEILEDNFIPGAFDVICARGKEAYQHRGNRSFRATLEHHLPAYANATNKLKKSEIVSAIFHAIEEATPKGGFIRKNDKGQWCRVPIHIAREKIGQGFRDLLFTEYRSSTKAKILRRRERLYPSNLSPDKKSAGSDAPSTKAIGPTADSAMPPLKALSFDTQPLPLGSSDEIQEDMTILRQCSFSFVKDKSSITHVEPRAENRFATSAPIAAQPVGPAAGNAARMPYYHPAFPVRASYPTGHASPVHALDSSPPAWPYPYHQHYPRHDRGGNYYHYARAWSWSGPPETEAGDGHPYEGYPNSRNAHSWGE